MSFRKKSLQPEEEPGSPQWMLTFSDCLTLLLTFFVLLMTFSSIGEDTIPGLRNAFRRIMPGFQWSDKMYRNTLTTIIGAEPVEAVLEGSEHATLEKGTSGLLKESAEFSDPFEPRVFLILSSKVFAGRAAAISPKGRQILDALAAYLKRVTNGVIIGEHNPVASTTYNKIELARASAVVDYLTTKGDLEAGRFGISLGSATGEQQLAPVMQKDIKEANSSVLEIVLLGKDIK